MMQHEIIIVDDHLLFARSLAGLIDSYEEYTVKHTFTNGSELVDKFSSGMKLPAIILLDINMPIMDGIATMKWLKKYQPKAKVLALSMEDNEQTVLAMLRNGAKGYLLKDIQPVLLKKALDTVIEQGFFHTQEVTKALMKSLNSENEEIVELKDVELQFMRLACEEKTYKEIADIMCKSHKTIDGYRQHLFEILEVKNRIGLVMYAIKNGIVEI
ncbi:MAG TPA: response regulator transcription factor [Lutibacter sp.]|nr:response regulator transcription factor [Lutibacter sp.]